MRPAVLAALLVTAACHTTVRSRTTPGGFVEEEGSCTSEDIGPQETCEERDAFDEHRTILVVAAVIAAVIAGATGVSYVRE